MPIMSGLLIRAPASLLQPLSVPAKLLSGPGPSNQYEAVGRALANPLLGHLHPEFLKIMDDVKEGIRYLFQTKNDWSFAISGTGHCAMEAACLNLLEPGETVLVCRNGIWGDRFAEIANRLSIKPIVLSKSAGSIFSQSELESALAEHRPSVTFVVHGESSSGTLQPLKAIGDACRRHGSLLLVDSVAAAGGVQLLTDEWFIDCVYTGSQKCLSCTPGVSLISFSELARQKILNRRTKPPSWYLDAKELANYWGCRTDEPPSVESITRRYHHTGPISLIYGLREALRLVAEEGLAGMWSRHSQAAELLWAGIDDLGLDCFVEDKEARAPTVTTIRVPDGVQWRDLSAHAMRHHSVEISGGLGPTAGSVWRIGLMGANANAECVRRILVALGDSWRSVARGAEGNAPSNL